MSIVDAKRKEKQVREEIVSLLAYFAVMDLMLDFNTLYAYLQIRSGQLMVKAQLSKLIKNGRVKQHKNYYGLINHSYPGQAKTDIMQAKLLKKAKRWGRAMGLVPFIRSVVVVNSAAYGNVHPQSDIDLLIITSPNRVFVVKGLLMFVLKSLRQLEDQFESAGRFSLGMFMTTKGAKMEKDMMKVNNPHLAYWLITARPVYGPGVWYGILKNDPYIQSKLPNYIWDKSSVRIYTSGLKIIDKLDDIGYRRHLRHTASQPKSYHPDAFIRVRPDIINLHHKGTSDVIANKWKDIVLKS